MREVAKIEYNYIWKLFLFRLKEITWKKMNGQIR